MKGWLLKYLLDQNVVREINAENPNKNVSKWLDSIDDSDISLSVLTLMESEKGIEMQRMKTTGDTSAKEKRANAIERAEQSLRDLRADYQDRLLGIDEECAIELGKLVGQKNKDNFDLGYAATAKRHNLILVTRNLSDLKGRGVKLLNPFDANPKVV